MILLRILAFIAGFALTGFTIYSAIQTFVLPRSVNVWLTRIVFRCIFQLFRIRLSKAETYEQRDQIMALFAPIALLMLPIVWVFLTMMGYMLMFWGVGIDSLYHAFWLSGSSLLTLGFAPVDNLAQMILAFTEATLGLGLVALLIAYLPTIYTAFSSREEFVTMLEVRAGSPPSAADMIIRFHNIQGFERFHDLWEQWEVWFTDLEESHTTFGVLSFFRSPKPHRSWITAAGVILDTASIVTSTLDMPRDPQAQLCIRSGYIALRSIADFFRIPHDPDPKPTDPISISRQEFDELYDQLKAEGIPLKPDRDQCWRDYAGWRVNYDTVLLALAALTMAPYAPWVSDRSLRAAHMTPGPILPGEMRKFKEVKEA
jgi:hypothetical protein